MRSILPSIPQVQALLRRISPQWLLGMIMVAEALAIGTAAVAYCNECQLLALPSGIDMVYSLLLMCAIALAFRFPVWVGDKTLVTLSTLPLYLLAMRLPPVEAAVAGSLGFIAGELWTRKLSRIGPATIATDAGRYALVAMFGSTIKIIAMPLAPDESAFLLGAVAMLAVELLSCPLSLAPLLGRRPFATMVGTASTVLLVDGAQYMLGVIGAVTVSSPVIMLGLLSVLAVAAYYGLKNTVELQAGTGKILEALADTVDLRDQFAGGHSRRVAEYCAGILRELRVGGSTRATILAAARVHDIGKIAIPDDILHKVEELTEEERAILRTHAERGADVLQRYNDFVRGASAVRHHHESWDGSGYPAGLMGEAIPFGARVIAVAETYDSLTSTHAHRSGLNSDQALGVLQNGRGRQWDAEIVDALVRTLAATNQNIKSDPSALPAEHESGVKSKEVA